MWGTMRGTASNVFHFVTIKPSHYEDDGYPIQWIRSAIPSNTLACLNALAEDAHRREILGPAVDIQLHTYDETNRRVRPERIIRTIRKTGGRALIGLVGVQSNQFPRAMDIARPFIDAGLPVLAGGFHVSGCIAMGSCRRDDICHALFPAACTTRTDAGRRGALMRGASREFFIRLFS